MFKYLSHAKPYTAVYDTHRQDFTTLKSYHGGNCFVFFHNNLKVVKKNVLVHSYALVKAKHLWLS